MRHDDLCLARNEGRNTAEHPLDGLAAAGPVADEVRRPRVEFVSWHLFPAQPIPRAEIQLQQLGPHLVSPAEPRETSTHVAATGEWRGQHDARQPGAACDALDPPREASAPTRIDLKVDAADATAGGFEDPRVTPRVEHPRGHALTTPSTRAAR